MEPSERIELLKSRSFSEKMGDTFAFIRLNLGVLLKSHILISLPLIFLIAGLFVLLFRDYFSLMHTIETGPFVDTLAEREGEYQWVVTALFSYFAVMPVSIVTFLILDLYARSETGQVTFEQVWASALHNMPRLLWAKFLMSLMILPAGVLLALPGIALMSLFLLVELLMLQHNYGARQAISRSGSIMGPYFWNAFGVNLASMSIFAVFCTLIVVPVSLLELWQDITVGVMDTDSFWSILAMAIRAFNLIAGYILFTIPTVAIGIQYFTIREQKSRGNIMERVKAIGVEPEKVNIYLEDEDY